MSTSERLLPKSQDELQTPSKRPVEDVAAERRRRKTALRRESRARMTPAQVEERRRRDRESKARKRLSLTPEQREEVRRRQRESKKRIREKMTPEELEEMRSRCQARRREKRMRLLDTNVEHSYQDSISSSWHGPGPADPRIVGTPEAPRINNVTTQNPSLELNDLPELPQAAVETFSCPQLGTSQNVMPEYTFENSLLDAADVLPTSSLMENTDNVLLQRETLQPGFPGVHCNVTMMNFPMFCSEQGLERDLLPCVDEPSNQIYGSKENKEALSLEDDAQVTTIETFDEGICNQEEEARPLQPRPQEALVENCDETTCGPAMLSRAYPEWDGALSLDISSSEIQTFLEDNFVVDWAEPTDPVCCPFPYSQKFDP